VRIGKEIFRKVLLVAAAIALLTVLMSCTSAAPRPTSPPTSGETLTSTPTPPPTLTAVPASDFISGASRVLPSIVVIEVTYGAGGIPGQPLAQGAAGTGWILNENGFVVTNDHVVADAKTITVTLADGRKFTSSAVRSEPQRDLAVIKINAQNLPVASVGDSSTLKVGQMVAAIGNSLDLGIRVTGGLVSRLGTSATYSITGQGDITLNGLIETDATINPGNSGGVLIDTSGEVIGIVNAGLEGPNTDIEGFGYAIAINDAVPIINQLVSQMP
jgi:serine protease Do